MKNEINMESLREGVAALLSSEVLSPVLILNGDAFEVISRVNKYLYYPGAIEIGAREDIVIDQGYGVDADSVVEYILENDIISDAIIAEEERIKELKRMEDIG